MIDKINNWIDSINQDYKSQRISCTRFENDFKGFYTPDFLSSAWFVLVDEVPRPDFPELRKLGMSEFIDLPVDGITYKNTYYLKRQCAFDLQIHFHELVHVTQWKTIGSQAFIERYINEILNFTYDHAPLEKMAYAADNHYVSKGETFDVPHYIKSIL